MICPKCGTLTVKLSVVECTTGAAEKRGCTRYRGIWYQQLPGQSCLGRDGALAEKSNRILRLAVSSVS